MSQSFSKSLSKSLLRCYLAPWVVVSVLLSACASAPVQEMSNARQALEAALQSGAAERAPIQTQAAQAALAEAEKSLKHHDFSHARQNAQEARSQAIEAHRIAQGASGATLP